MRTTSFEPRPLPSDDLLRLDGERGDPRPYVGPDADPRVDGEDAALVDGEGVDVELVDLGVRGRNLTDAHEHRRDAVEIGRRTAAISVVPRAPKAAITEGT
jgi:hypothetical protein